MRLRFQMAGAVTCARVDGSNELDRYVTCGIDDE